MNRGLSLKGIFTAGKAWPADYRQYEEINWSDNELVFPGFRIKASGHTASWTLTAIIWDFYVSSELYKLISLHRKVF